MKRLFFPLAIAALSLCQNVNAQYPSPYSATRMPNARLASTEKTEAMTTMTTNNSAMGGGYYANSGYGFGSNNCGCNPGCCDNAWAGYSRSCGLFGKHHGGCGACGGCGCCFGNSFAGGCGNCGMLGGCGCGHHLGQKLHAHCHNFLSQCKSLFHGACGCDMGCGCTSMVSSGCGCGANGYMPGANGYMPGVNEGQQLNAPPTPPAETVPSAEPSPSATPASAKSAKRVYPRPYGVFPTTW